MKLNNIRVYLEKLSSLFFLMELWK